MSYQQHINRLVDEGFDISIGKHDGCTGYYAEVCKDENTEICEICDCPMKEDLWYNAGHGFTIEEALLNAESIAKGREPHKKYDPKDFERVK